MIDATQFLQIIDSTPLVSIDLILEDQQGRVLLGKRKNKPAEGCWFVPGGRIRKNETLADAFRRISKTELGSVLDIEDAQLLGAYDHIYEDNFQGKEGVNTHYVALGYSVKLPTDFAVEFDDQHSEIMWCSKTLLLEDADVHANTKNYFRSR